MGPLTERPTLPTTLAADPREVRPLTGLRLFAAAWVVLFHFQFTHGALLARVFGPGYPVVTTGAMGVDLFFVLSGFVIALTYLGKLGPRPTGYAAARFLWARVCRIWPVYALVTTGFLGWLLLKRWYWDIGEPAYQNVQPSLGVLSWLRQLSLTQMWTRPWHDGASFVGPAWSVSAECLAYLLFPLTALVFWRLRRMWRPALLLVAVALMAPESYLCFTTGSPYFLLSWLARIMLGFGSGVLVYLAVREIPRTRRVRRAAGLLAWLLVVLVFAGLAYGAWLGPAPEGTERGGVVLVLFPLLVAALALGGSGSWLTGPGRLLSTRWAVHGGRISYSLYLVHVPLFEVFWTLMERVGVLRDDGPLATALAPVVFLAAFVLADLLYRLVEEPARRGLRRFTEPRPAAPARPGTVSY